MDEKALAAELRELGDVLALSNPQVRERLNQLADHYDPRPALLRDKVARTVYEIYRQWQSGQFENGDALPDRTANAVIDVIVDDLIQLPHPEPLALDEDQPRTAYIKGVADAQGRWLLRLQES